MLKQETQKGLIKEAFGTHSVLSTQCFYLQHALWLSAFGERAKEPLRNLVILYLLFNILPLPLYKVCIQFVTTFSLK